jgi:hypothetical protein
MKVHWTKQAEAALDARTDLLHCFLLLHPVPHAVQVQGVPGPRHRYAPARILTRALLRASPHLQLSLVRRSAWLARTADVRHSEFIEILWAFSIYLESVAILPQLFMLQRTGEAETITTHYLFALGAYRALYIPNWIYRYFTEDSVDAIAIVAGLVQTALYSDFFYVRVALPVPALAQASMQIYYTKCATRRQSYKAHKGVTGCYEDKSSSFHNRPAAQGTRPHRALRMTQQIDLPRLDLVEPARVDGHDVLARLDDRVDGQVVSDPHGADAYVSVSKGRCSRD